MTYDPKDNCGCRGQAGCPTCDVLTNQVILDSFPGLYNHPGLFDFSPHAKWLPILYTLSEKLSQYNVRCMQVKAKFGSLRYYTSAIPADQREAVHALITEAEDAVEILEGRKPIVWIHTPRKP